MEKKQICESDSWFWLPPTERVKTFIVSVDTWVLVIYCLLLLFFKANQLLYFERWVWEKPFFSLGTSPRLNLPVTATVLCQSFSGPCLEMKSQETGPISPKYWKSCARAAALLSLHTSVFVIENTMGKHSELWRRQYCKYASCLKRLWI